MYTSMAQIKAANRRSDQPHWFEPSTMGFFDSKVESAKPIAGRFFVTSEQPPGGERGYTVRQADVDGRIHTVGEFLGHETLEDAVKAARAAAGHKD